jgi:predicted ATPase/class 3 adenylate cyclase
LRHPPSWSDGVYRWSQVRRGRIVRGVAALPSGTVTFLFTDIESSTRRWEIDAAVMDVALARHDRALRDAVDAHSGVVVKATGDGMLAVFDRVAAALDAAVDAQRTLRSNELPAARMAVHSGEAFERDGDYFGPALNRAARLMAIGHGGQILVSGATAALAQTALPSDMSLRDMGEHRLRDLAEPMAVFQVVHPELVVEFPPLRSLDPAPGNLPRQMTSFVGRERDVEQVAALIRERWLVTLTGVGGVGKTRLALQAAAEAAPSFSDGAWLCELAPVVDPAAVWETIAASLGVRPSPGLALSDVVLEFLGSKRLLIVLDNCEHLLSGVAIVVGAIAQRCPRTAVLATSREGLAVTGEQMVAVPSLPVPAIDADPHAFAEVAAVRLFCDRARDANPNFKLDDGNAAAVGQLCRRLDGIPLAIELAAARARSLSPEDLVARLDERFRLLTRGSRSALERHQTLRQTIDWSYDLLSTIEQTGLNRTAVFAGGFDLKAAEAIVAGDGIESGEVLDVLAQLVDKSLIDVDTSAGMTRYVSLETIRQYAQERLAASGETTAVRDRHLHCYVTRAEAAGPKLRGRAQLDAASFLEPDIDNLRAALDYSVDVSQPDPALRLVAALSVTGLPIGWTAIGWAQTPTAIPDASNHELFPAVAAFASLNETLSGDLERAAILLDRAETAQAALGTQHTWLHAARATLSLFRGEFGDAQREAELWLDQARASGDPYEITYALTSLAGALVNTDQTASAAVADEAVQVARDAGILSALPNALAMSLRPGDLAHELEVRDEIIAVALTIGDRQLAASNVAMRESLLARREDWDWPTSLRTQTDAALQYLNGGNMMLAISHLHVVAVAYAALKHYEPAAIVLGFADAHIARLGPEEYKQYLTATDAALSTTFGPQALAELKARGAALDFADVVLYVRQQTDILLSK